MFLWHEDNFDENNQGLKDLASNFDLSHKCLKEFRSRACSPNGGITTDICKDSGLSGGETLGRTWRSWVHPGLHCLCGPPNVLHLPNICFTTSMWIVFLLFEVPNLSPQHPLLFSGIVSKVRASVTSTSYSVFLGLSHVCYCCRLGTQLCPILCNPMDCSPSGSSVHGIFQARILQWVVIPSFRGSSQPRYQTWVSCIAGRFFIIWDTREAQKITNVSISIRELNPRLLCDRWGH